MLSVWLSHWLPAWVSLVALLHCFSNSWLHSISKQQVAVAAIVIFLVMILLSVSVERLDLNSILFLLKMLKILSQSELEWYIDSTALLILARVGYFNCPVAALFNWLTPGSVNPRSINNIWLKCIYLEIHEFFFQFISVRMVWTQVKSLAEEFNLAEQSFWPFGHIKKKLHSIAIHHQMGTFLSYIYMQNCNMYAHL